MPAVRKSCWSSALSPASGRQATSESAKGNQGRAFALTFLTQTDDVVEPIDLELMLDDLVPLIADAFLQAFDFAVEGFAVLVEVLLLQDNCCWASASELWASSTSFSRCLRT